MAPGATDRQTGERFAISIRTVEKHTETVRSKLGMEPQTAVAEGLSAN